VRVATRVQQHIGDDRPRLTRRLEHAGEVAVDEDAPAPSERAVDPPREAHGQPANALAERPGVSRLDDQVQVVGLDRVVDEAEAVALLAAPEALLDVRAQAVAAEGRQRVVDLERDMDRVARGDARQGAVRRVARLLGLAPGSLSTATPGVEGQAELRASARPLGARPLGAAARAPGVSCHAPCHYD
jgi:hypothetical protein